jgi:hypothetical protein
MQEIVAGSGGRAKAGLRDRLLEGFEQLKAGDLDAARATFSQLVRTNPGIVAAHLGLGRPT